VRDVQAQLVHRPHNGRVDLVGGGAACGADVNPAGCGVVEQGGGHLGATGVVDANEQDFGDLGHEHSLGVGGCGEPVGGEIGPSGSTRAW